MAKWIIREDANFGYPDGRIKVEFKDGTSISASIVDMDGDGTSWRVWDHDKKEIASGIVWPSDIDWRDDFEAARRKCEEYICRK